MAQGSSSSLGATGSMSFSRISAQCLHSSVREKPLLSCYARFVHCSAIVVYHDVSSACHSPLPIIEIVSMTKCLFRKLPFKHLFVCARICAYLYKVEWSACIYSMFPRGDTQGYSAYVLHDIDLLEKTNVIAVDMPPQGLTE